MKKRLTRFLPFLLAFTIALPSYSVFAEEENQAKETQTNETNETQADETTANDTLSLAAETAVLIDAASGEILYDKDADKKMYPASITKLMTILLALENGKLTDEITFSHDAVYNIEPGSAHIAILEGETLTLEQVLRAIILRSANEASNGVAEYVDGSVEAFAKHMTERAKELGCTNTNFVNANGLFDENHYTTAHDMALIARELLKHEEYRSMMSETDYEIPPTNLQTETRYLHGQHQMLNPNSIYYYKDAIGGKTGYTVEAGNTLVTYAERDGLTLIAVVMKCNGAEHYTDTAALFDYGFANYASVKIAAVSDYTSTVPVTETYNKKAVALGKVTIAPSEDVYYTLPKGTDASAVTVKTDIPEGVEGAVKKGQTLGTLQLSYNGKTQTVDLIAQNAVDALTDTQKAELDKSSLSGMVKRVAIGVGIAVIVLLLIFCITRFIGYRSYQRRSSCADKDPAEEEITEDKQKADIRRNKFYGVCFLFLFFIIPKAQGFFPESHEYRRYRCRNSSFSRPAPSLWKVGAAFPFHSACSRRNAQSAHREINPQGMCRRL